MKTKRNPEPDVAKILDIDHFFNPRKGLKRWLVVTFLVAATLITVAIWIKMKNSSSAQYKTEQSVKKISPIKLK
jgi:hypothetical protein